MSDTAKKPAPHVQSKGEMPDELLEKVAGGWDKGRRTGYSTDPEDQYGKYDRG